MARMAGRIHGPQCDCNSEHVSGVGEKCNRRYGTKRQRAREKEQARRMIRAEVD